jgi:hypothetical protein
MRLTIVHDSKGNITGLVAYPADGPAAYPAMRPGEFVTQVDVAEITSELGADKVFERLSELAQNYRIDVESKATLTKKAESKAEPTKK